MGNGTSAGSNPAFQPGCRHGHWVSVHSSSRRGDCGTVKPPICSGGPGSNGAPTTTAWLATSYWWPPNSEASKTDAGVLRDDGDGAPQSGTGTGAGFWQLG